MPYFNYIITNPTIVKNNYFVIIPLAIFTDGPDRSYNMLQFLHKLFRRIDFISFVMMFYVLANNFSAMSRCFQD